MVDHMGLASLMLILQGRMHTDRQLQLGSDCYCPSGSLELSSPTAEEFLVTFNKSIQLLRGEGIVMLVSSVDDLMEVEPVTCSSDINFIENGVLVEVQGDLDAVTALELSPLGGAFEQASNKQIGKTVLQPVLLLSCQR